MKLCVGPVEPSSAQAWLEWVQGAVRDLRREPGLSVTVHPQVLDAVSSYVGSWAGATPADGGVFRWEIDVHPDELEYLTNALYHLDLVLAEEAGHVPERAEPGEARAFHVALVHALLFALAQAGPSRAAFVEQLRPAWPVVGGLA